MMKIILTILLDLVILILVIVCVLLGFRFYKAFAENKSLVTTLFDNRDLLVQMHLIRDEEWKKFDAPSFSFDYPQHWSPHMRELMGGGNETEAVDLKIPIFLSISRLGANNIIGYSKDDIVKRRPTNDLLLEQDYVVANRKATKWIYKKDSLFHYEYILNLSRFTLNGKNISTFYLHVESATRDANLEKQLDQVASSIKFKADENQGQF